MATLVFHRRRASWRSFLAVAAAAATGLMVYSYLSYVKAQIPITGKLVPMVVAATDIQPGQQIEAAMLQIVDHPSRWLPHKAVSTKDAAVGRVAGVPIFKGEPLISTKIGVSGGSSSVVPRGMRAYTLSPAAGASGAFAARPGDRVDVLATLPDEALGRPVTSTILRSKQVASAGGEPRPGRVAGLGLGEKSSGRSITLFVTPDEAQRLAMAESLGKITVVLAPAAGDEQPAPGPVTARDIGA